MGFYAWRLRISLAAAQERIPALRDRAEPENQIGRWREAMARERESRFAWSMATELVPVRVIADRPRR